MEKFQTPKIMEILLATGRTYCEVTGTDEIFLNCAFSELANVYGIEKKWPQIVAQSKAKKENK